MFAFLKLWSLPAKIGAAVGAVALLIGLFFGAKALYDHSIIKAHDAGIEASAAKADRAADTKAADQRVIDITRETQEEDQLKKAVDHAVKDPKIPDDVERNLAFHRCLRLQQAARANGLKPPACV
jgi:chorismate mutase